MVYIVSKGFGFGEVQGVGDELVIVVGISCVVVVDFGDGLVVVVVFGLVFGFGGFCIS